LIDRADVLIGGVRPGLMERLGLEPETCPERLIYGRMTGRGQQGPRAARGA
jgi:alpha-methylacyl-CoA racemase